MLERLQSFILRNALLTNPLLVSLHHPDSVFRTDGSEVWYFKTASGVVLKVLSNTLL